MAGGITRRFGPVGGAGLVEDVADVGSDGTDGDDQYIGDLPVGSAGRYQADDIQLSLG